MDGLDSRMICSKVKTSTASVWKPSSEKANADLQWQTAHLKYKMVLEQPHPWVRQELSILKQFLCMYRNSGQTHLAIKLPDAKSNMPVVI